MKITTDTNVLISATFWTGSSYKILDLIDKKQIELILSSAIIGEYKDVVNREEITDKVANKKLITSSAVDKAVNEASIIQPINKLEVVKNDPDDDKILETAIEGEVDYIVSRDKHLLNLKKFEGIEILTPEEFLKKISKNT